MYPQSELDNYKLQVELLQERLKRSEENREQLTQQLEQIFHKRSEHDKSARVKSRQKYQEFLDEQHKRNERNKLLMQMLDRVDNQTAALSARSERLKMMKLQYEMYFAKLVQAQTMRCIQPSAAPHAAGIPVLLAPTNPANSSSYGGNISAAPSAEQQQQTPHSGGQELMAVPLSAPLQQQHQQQQLQLQSQQQQQQQWTLAMAVPAPGGMLLPPGAAPSYLAAANTFDYLRYPIGYMASPRMHAYMAGGPPAAIFDSGHDLQQTNRNYSANSSAMGRGCNEPYQETASHNNNNNCYLNNYNDLGTTLRDFDKMNDAMELPLQPPAAAVAAHTPDKRTVEPATLTCSATTTTPTTTIATTGDVASLDNAAPNEIKRAPTPTSTAAELPEQSPRTWQQQQQQLSTTTMPPLTFDKSPKSLLERTKENIARIDAALPALSARTGPPTAATSPAATMLDKRNDVASALAHAMQPQIALNGDDFAPHPQLPAGLSTLTTSSMALSSYDGAPQRQKINEDAAGRVNSDDWFGLGEATQDARQQQQPQPHAGLGEAASSAVMAPQDRRPQAATSNQYAPAPLAAVPTPAATTVADVAHATPVSIEKIENAIYGELVQPPAVEDSVQLRSPTQGVLENFLAQPQMPVVPAKPPQIVSEPQAAADVVPTAAPDYPAYATIGGEETTVSDSSYAQEASEPTYASIDGANNGNAEMYAATAASDGSGYGDMSAAANAEQQPQEQQQQEYDYSNYDASQYGGAYDPNAYPGYTYDEATGQYIADDPNQQQQEAQQYASDADYAQQGYEQQAQQQQQQQYDDGNQQQLAADAYDYGNYGAQQAEQAAYGEAVSAESAAAELASEGNIEGVAATMPSKPAAKTPTSILSTPAAAAATSAAASDAQTKKKKRVNFVDSSETDDSASVKAASSPAAGIGVAGGGDSDFDFSASEQTA